ncbi:MAG: glycosyltransferase family 4 protein [Nitrospinota bacterium]|nr:glycosyltransferase family 4 protein [Nitrospinota bacterium]
MKISFLCFDLSDNSLGRAALLAEALAKHHTVELLGPARQGRLWPPMENISIPVKLFPWQRYPQFIITTRKILKAIDGDVIFACKLRPTSFGLGLLKQKEIPLLVDIDDWELGFFYGKGFWSSLGKFLNLSNPNGLPYSWLMERMVNRADGITVSNRFLQQKFCGELIYHCRDTGRLDPQKFDPAQAKKKLGLEHKKILMFLGTPRAHKGIDDVARAMEQIKTPDAHLVLIGSAGEVSEAVKQIATVLPTIPISEVGDYLAAADVVLVPQRHTHETVGQMPAKIFDAMAMAKPIISTRVSDIPEVLGDCGYLIEPGNAEQLAEAIDHALSHEDEARSRGQKARKRCQKLYDTRLLEEKLVAMVRQVTESRKSQ